MNFIQLSKLDKAALLFCSILLLAPQSIGYTWNYYNDPARMDPEGIYQYHLDKIPHQSSLTTVPWSENYWPTNQGLINYRWNSSSPSGFNYRPYSKEQVFKLSFEEMKALAPSEKYDLFMGRYDYPLFNEVRSHSNPYAKDWSGICDGWSIAATQFDEPRPTTVVNGDGLVIPFGSSDIKGLMSYVAAYHFKSNALQAGLSCKWWSRNGACSDINAGSLHVILGNQIGVLQKAFVTEIYTGSEIWNQPTYAYEFEYLGSAPSNAGDHGVRVRGILHYTDELEVSNWDPVVGTSNFKHDQLIMEYVLDLDEQNQIIGGTWISGSDRPDFVWKPRASLEFTGYFSGIYRLYRPNLIY